MSDWEKLLEISNTMESMAAELQECSQLVENIKGKLIKIMK